MMGGRYVVCDRATLSQPGLKFLFWWPWRAGPKGLYLMQCGGSRSKQLQVSQENHDLVHQRHGRRAQQRGEESQLESGDYLHFVTARAKARKLRLLHCGHDAWNGIDSR